MARCSSARPTPSPASTRRLLRDRAEDAGSHTVCAIVSDEFLAFSRRAGNDLSTPQPQSGFPGLSGGDRWCLCAARWLEARDAGCGPRVLLAATHERALDVIPIEALLESAADPGPPGD